MSTWVKPDFDAEQKQQASLRRKLEDLRETLHVRNSSWNSWELEFIHDMTEKLSMPTIHVSPKQTEIIDNLWEKI